MGRSIKYIREAFGESLQLKQLSVLLDIAIAHPEPVTFSDLQEQAGTSSGTVSRTISMYGMKMVEKENGKWEDVGLGFVESRPNPYNTRQYVANLTPKGVRVMDLIMKKQQER